MKGPPLGRVRSSPAGAGQPLSSPRIPSLTSPAGAGTGRGLALAVIGSLVTTFAGLVADPLQVATVTHRRRILRLLDQLDRAEPGSGIEREHLLARAGDLSDALLMLWRNLR